MNDKKILEDLAQIKWGNSFCCTKCGGKSYSDGKSPYSRRCKNTGCRYEESLKKYTVFDGLNISIEIGCGILLDIFNVSRVYFDTDISIVGNNDKQYDTLGHYINERERLQEEGNRQIDENITEGTIYKHIDKHRRESSVSNLSKKYKVEEPTIIKFLDKVNERFSLEVHGEKYTSYERLIEVFCDLFDWDITQFYKVIITATPVSCYYGTFVTNNKMYGFDFENEEFSKEEEESQPNPVICEVEPKEHIYTQVTIHNKEHIEEEVEETHYKVIGKEVVYGSDEWKIMFGIK